MPYATESDINNEFRGGLQLNHPNNSIDSDVISDFLVQADSEINLHLFERYDLPITGSESLELLKKIEIDLVACRIVKIKNLKSSAPVPDGKPVQNLLSYFESCRKSEELLAKIKNGDYDLPDEELKNNTGGLASYHTDNNEPPFFIKNTEQW